MSQVSSTRLDLGPWETVRVDHEGRVRRHGCASPGAARTILDRPLDDRRHAGPSARSGRRSASSSPAATMIGAATLRASGPIGTTPRSASAIEVMNSAGVETRWLSHSSPRQKAGSLMNHRRITAPAARRRRIGMIAVRRRLTIVHCDAMSQCSSTMTTDRSALVRRSRQPRTRRLVEQCGIRDPR